MLRKAGQHITFTGHLNSAFSFAEKDVDALSKSRTDLYRCCRAQKAIACHTWGLADVPSGLPRSWHQHDAPRSAAATSGHYADQSHHHPGPGEPRLRTLLWRIAGILGRQRISRPVVRWVAAIQSHLGSSAPTGAGAYEPGL